MESLKDATAVAIEEETQVAAARRAAADLCRRLGLLDSTISRAELVAVELAGNILHHAKRGKLYVAPIPERSGLLMIAVDQGPGMSDVPRAMQDGFSTASTPGLGLGAVQRQAGQLDLYSRYDAGTVLSAVLVDEEIKPDFGTAVLSVPLEGETVNGDTWSVYRQTDRTIYLMVDGLGHGHNAAAAAAMAVRVANTALDSEPGISLSDMMQRMHLPMQATRGAAVMLVSCVATSAGHAHLLCCGIGNISAVLTAPDGTTRALVSHNGTVGHRMARVQEFAYPATAGTVLVMHSDGISTRWKLAQYPGLHQHAPATIAGVIFRDAARDRDDATVLVTRIGGVAHA